MRHLLAAVLCLFAVTAMALSFSEEEEKAAREASVPPPAGVSKACRDSLTKRRVVVLIGERSGSRYSAEQASYGGLFQVINDKLRAQGLRTYTPAEIRKQIAQAEIDAYFRNDPDAALAAAKKLGADHVLRGLIVSRRGLNPVLRIDEVAINMSFTLTDAGGRTLASASAAADSYSGADVYGMALTLVSEQADGIVDKLVSGLCAKTARK